MPSVFFSYSHVDEHLRDQLEKQLAMLKRQGVIETWHDRCIGAGQSFDRAIDDHINSDEIILLLVSADFLASDYCYEIELKRAMERHHAGEAIVIPVILRACDWHHAPFGKLNASPRDGKPITQWPDIDEAFLQVAKALRKAAEGIHSDLVDPILQNTPVAETVDTRGTHQLAEPRSSNLRVAKSFTQRDKDKYRIGTFEFIARYIENSLAELGSRNEDYEGVFRRVDAVRFFATIYRDGESLARATVYIGEDRLNPRINFTQGETMKSNSMNESLTVQADDQTLYLSSMGMAFQGNHQNQKLSQQGAAELYWSILIGPLQQRSSSWKY